MFTSSSYEISVLLKRIVERENIIMHEGHYQSNLDDCVKEESSKDKDSLDLVLLDYKHRLEWTRSFLNMCQNKKLQLDIISVFVLNKALELIKQQALKNQYVLTFSTLSAYYTMPLIECIISPEVGIVGIHVPLLKTDVVGLSMKKVVTPTYAWNDYTCSVDIPSITIATTQKNTQWTILIPKCDPFKEELSLVTETRSVETLPLLYVKQLQLQFENLYSCLNYDNVKDSSTPIATYFVIINFLLTISVIGITAYLHVKIHRKFDYYERQKFSPMGKNTFNLGTVRFSKPKQSFSRPQDRPLPNPVQEEEKECEYLTTNQLNLPSTSTITAAQRKPPTILTNVPTTTTIIPNQSGYVPMNKFFANNLCANSRASLSTMT
ncbi:hypothetical protein FQR65_LT20002 [Abscondita terminalis]|nr:hypothetical protein FQR65_LT20002 [Abscondita terminalis]